MQQQHTLDENTYHDFYVVSTEFPFSVYETLKRLCPKFNTAIVAIDGMSVETCTERDFEALKPRLDPSLLYLVRHEVTIQMAMKRVESLFDEMESELQNDSGT